MAATTLWTVEELERIGFPEGRWELIDGELVPRSLSGAAASAVSAAFVFHLADHVLPRKLGSVFAANGGFVVYPDPGREQLRAPDAAFVRADRVPPRMRGFPHLAPDLVVEVISPSDEKSDVIVKAGMWVDAGVRIVWVADPDEQTVTILQPGQTPFTLRSGDVLAGGAVLPRFRVAVTKLFDASW